VLLKNSGNAKRITDAVLGEVVKEREGEFIKRSTIKTISEMLFVITKDTKERVYYDYIESPYINQLSEYLKLSCKKLMSELTMANYLLEAEKIIEWEMKRGKELLVAISQENMFKCLRVVLIESNTAALLVNDYSWFKSLIQQNRLEDINRAYRLFSNKTTPQVFGQFIKTLDLILTQIGEKEIQQLIVEHAWLKIIDSLLVIINKYESLLLNQFNKNVELEKVVRKVLMHLVNFDDTVCKALAFYYNHILSKSAPQVSNGKQEQHVERLMAGFKRIRTKDSFAMYYTQLMAKRLLSKASEGDDAERSILRGFKAECGI
jgi:hypothetical protein